MEKAVGFAAPAAAFAELAAGWMTRFAAFAA
jgi:hypothetical protein